MGVSGAFQRVLMVNPPGTSQDGYSGPPLGLLYLAGSLRDVGVDVRVLDGIVCGWEKIGEMIREYRPGIVGVPCLTPARHESLRVLNIAKSVDRGIVTIMGGAHASIMWKQILSYYENVDIIVVGEGEQTIREIAAGKPLDSIDGIAYRVYDTIIKNTPRANVENLDIIALPAWDLVDLDSYPARGVGVYNGVDISRTPRISVLYGRGCVGSCSFCSSWWIWKQYRHRSPISMVAELEYLYSRGARHFYFVDDTFTVDRLAILELCDLIIESGMRIAFVASTRCDLVDPVLLEKLREAGCYELSFGVESGSQKILDDIGKKQTPMMAERAIQMCRMAGIRVIALLIIGNIGETHHTILETLRLLKRSRPDGIGTVGGLWILPGTRVYEYCKHVGYIDDDFWLQDRPYKVYAREHSFFIIKLWERIVLNYKLLASFIWVRIR